MARSKHTSLRTLGALGACVTAAVGLIACGGSDETTVAAAEPDLDRFCELIDQVNSSSADAYSAMEAAEGSPTPDLFAATQRQIIADNVDRIAEAQQVAPDGIREDFVLFTDSARERSEQDDRSVPDDEAAASERVQKFVSANCELPSSQPPSG
jgi:hypothetical protein